jgi:ribonuclease D
MADNSPTPVLTSAPEVEEQIVSHPDELRTCCDYLAGCPRIGFDTEFVGEDTYHPHLCLVQVSTPERLILIDPLSAGPPDCFWNLVIDPARQVIVHAGREEVRLCHLWTGRRPGNLFDLQIAAGLVGLPYPLGHGAIVNQLLGVQISKGETLTEWRSRPLTRSQVRYAFDDVRYLLPLGQRLTERLAALDRLDWAQEEFARLTSSALPEDPAAAAASERWRKLRGLGSLDRRKLAVVRELFFWREETATRTNRPARTICRDDLIGEIARRNPTRERDLHVIRGLPRRDLPAILELVKRARDLPLEQCPRVAEREQDPPQVGLVANVLAAVLGDYCTRNRLAPNLVANSSDLKLLVRMAMRHGRVAESNLTASLLSQGWRSQFVLPVLRDVLEGRRGIRIADVSADAPLTYD